MYRSLSDDLMCLNTFFKTPNKSAVGTFAVTLRFTAGVKPLSCDSVRFDIFYAQNLFSGGVNEENCYSLNFSYPEF